MLICDRCAEVVQTGEVCPVCKQEDAIIWRPDAFKEHIWALDEQFAYNHGLDEY